MSDDDKVKRLPLPPRSHEGCFPNLPDGSRSTRPSDVNTRDQYPASIEVQGQRVRDGRSTPELHSACAHIVHHASSRGPIMPTIYKNGDRVVADGQWASDQVREYVAHLQHEVERTFTFPPAIQRDPEALARAKTEAWRATEVIRREIVPLTARHCFPQIRISGR